nr:PREDICTED: protein sax-3-like [Latimeria chalumnae]|eukprot:XP_014352093.1 PREDICTED: protein sax-3-like [Latimeria chalumnae]
MEWKFVRQPSNLTAKTGDPAVLSCRPPFSKPPAIVSWFKDGNILRKRPHYFIDDTGDLVFHRLQETDKGVYFCRASNPHLLRFVASQKIFLELLVPPSVTVTPQMDTVPVGSGALFQCQVRGKPSPYITWYKQSHPINAEGRIFMGYV